jgi:hypothetical protein
VSASYDENAYYQFWMMQTFAKRTKRNLEFQLEEHFNWKNI